MINIDLKDNELLMSLNGKHSKVIVEIFITLTKLAGAEPETISETKKFLKLLEDDLKNGSDAETIIKELMMAYHDVFN